MRNGCRRSVQMLIQAAISVRSPGEDVPTLNAVCDGGLTLVHLVHRNTIDLLPELSANGCHHLNTPDIEGRTPLHYTGSDPGAFRLLTSLGASIDVIDDRNQTLLHHMAYDNSTNEEIIAEVIRLRPEWIDAVDISGWTPFHCAVSSGTPGMIRLILLEANARQPGSATRYLEPWPLGVEAQSRAVDALRAQLENERIIQSPMTLLLQALGPEWHGLHTPTAQLLQATGAPLEIPMERWNSDYTLQRLVPIPSEKECWQERGTIYFSSSLLATLLFWI